MKPKSIWELFRQFAKMLLYRSKFFLKQIPHSLSFASILARFLAWIGIAAVVGFAGLIAYSWMTFREIEEVMSETPKNQPTLIYSDIYLLKKGADFANTFLKERLKDLNLPFLEEKVDPQAQSFKLSWKTPAFDYPEPLVSSLAPDTLLPATDASVSVLVEQDRISEIKVNNLEVQGVVLQPDVIAQLSGSNKTIREYSKLDDIPTVLKEAIISVEDMRFRDHYGFDIRSLARAFWINIKQRSLAQGGSTITQQLVKNLLKTHKKTLSRKSRELVLAVLIEAKYEKEQILEKYLNEVYFGQIGSLEVHGVTEAAKYFFNKNLNQLSIAEMAFIAGIIRGPAVYSPYKHLDRALARKNVVLKKLAEQRYIAGPEFEAASKEKLIFSPPNQGRNQAPYFVDYVKAQTLDALKDRVSEDDLSSQGLRIFTTVDMPLQRRATASVSSTVKDLETRFKVTLPLRLEGILAVSETQSGFLRAIVGGRAYNETTFNRVLNMKRPVGSTIKPVAYLAALLKGQDKTGITYSPSYLVDDAPFTYEFDRKTWTPHNYEKHFLGKVTLRDAFSNSINTVMARVGLDVGLDRVIETAQKLGVTTTLQPNPSLLLGAAELNALELLQVYSTFANRGTFTDLTAIRTIVDKDGHILARFVPRTEKIYDTAVVDILNSMLKSVVTDGTAKHLAKLGYTKPSFGKTGTTNFYRDAWFAGFTEGLAAVAWVGFDQLKVTEKSPAKLTGGSAALPVWSRFFTQARPSKLAEIEPPLDPSLIQVKIDRTKNCKAVGYTPAENLRDEIFLPGTVPADCK